MPHELAQCLGGYWDCFDNYAVKSAYELFIAADYPSWLKAAARPFAGSFVAFRLNASKERVQTVK
jgi:hypothetical protein